MLCATLRLFNLQRLLNNFSFNYFSLCFVIINYGRFLWLISFSFNLIRFDGCVSVGKKKMSILRCTVICIFCCNYWFYLFNLLVWCFYRFLDYLGITNRYTHNHNLNFLFVVGYGSCYVGTV